MSNWREIRNIITIEDSLGFEIKEYPSKSVIMYKFNCLICKKSLQVRRQHIQYSTGKCKKHANQLRPFEAVYGAMRRRSKERKLKFNLSYEEYIEFTKINNCYYCNDKINWDPYNEHGKNNPGYYLDRMNNDIGYIKSNCVVCCTTCNMAKRSMHHDNFIDMCLKISKEKGSSCGD